MAALSSLQLVKRWGYRVIVTAAIAFTIQDTVIEPHPVSGPSMSPTLSPNYHEAGKRDTLLVFKRIDRARDIKRGDVVVFWKPHDPEGLSVKRVLGVEGDTIFRDVRRVGREQQKLDRGEKIEAYKRGMAQVPPIVRVPVGSIWVEGDNWRESLDSNDFGPVCCASIYVAKIVRLTISPDIAEPHYRKGCWHRLASESLWRSEASQSWWRLFDDEDYTKRVPRSRASRVAGVVKT
jgi:mitochondrial inner membrane protease subunit 2